MAALTAGQRSQVERALMRHWSKGGDSVAFVRNALSTAVGECDDWIDGNEDTTSTNEGLNTALSAPFKTQATENQKDDLLAFVAARRRSIDLLRRLENNTE